MAIKGLTDSVQPRFPSLGRLRKGGAQQKNKDGRNVYGKDLNYFRFTSERPEIVRAFTDAYGEQPAALHIFLPYAQLEDNFSTWKEHWLAGGLQHRCDGETCTIWLDKASGKYMRTPRPCPGGCDEVGRLTVILPELLKAGYVGYVTLETHSVNDLINITASLAAVVEARIGNDLGLRGVEFILRRKPENISTPGWGENKGQRQRVEKWLVSIEPVPTWAETQLRLASQPELPQLMAGNGTVATSSGFVDEATGEVLNPPDVEEGEIIEHDTGPFAAPLAFLNSNPPCQVAETRRAEWAKGCLRLLWGQNRELRDAFLTWAFGTNNADALTSGQCAGIIEFVKPAKVGDEYVPDDKAIAFAGQFRAHLEGPDDADAFGDE